ncbi:MAG: NAD-dependent epimerase/dehydratase [Pseudonocardiales bacterium]|nr:NAD-dependent epimerase/dehydratase [Pseudonocardiales bacterium]
MSSRDILVTGASGFVGSHLARALVDKGHRVRAMTRHPDDYDGAGDPIGGDVADAGSLIEPLRGVHTAYYLVHSLDSADFEDKDSAAARHFGQAAADAGVQRIVYLGGLGEDNDRLSPHLRSRREVEALLGEGGVPVTTLRAAVVIGHGGISWELTRQLVAHVPVMVAPKWVNTRTQPIALVDVIRYLVGVLDDPRAEGQVYEVGGPDVLRYKDMMSTVARLQNKRLLPVLTVPLLTPRLSSAWLALVTDVDVQTARTLIDSMTNEVVVHDHAIEQIVPGESLSYEDAVRVALADRADAEAAKEAEPAETA